MKNHTFVIIAVLFLVFLMVTGVINAQVDVPRRTTAITYPLDQQVMVQFRGTTRFPRMKGSAKIKRTGKTGSQIDLSVSKMPRPFELGAGYATYVLWAISPNGQADNLGEIKRRGFWEFDSTIKVTTPLQTFALVVTAEPHFLVSRPSQEIMLENLNPYTSSGRSIGTMSVVQYFGNSSDYFRDTRTPEIAEQDYAKMPSSILQANQAIALAKFAGAERDAPEELREAQTLLQNSEASWRAGRDSETVDITARKSISASVNAESTAQQRREAREKRNEQARIDAEARKTEQRFSDAQQEIDSIKAELARETRNRELAEREAMTFSNQVKDLRIENGRLREELGRIKLETETAKAKLAAIENEKIEAQEKKDREVRLAAARANESKLIQSLKTYGQVAKVDGSIVLVLNESYWSGTRSTDLAMTSDGKLTSIGEMLANNPDYFVVIESHTDNTGTPTAKQELTDNRARIIADKLESVGVNQNRIRARGFADTIPVAANNSNRNRAMNQRMHIILTLPSE